MPANHKIKPQQKIVDNEEWSFMANIKKEKNWMQIYLKKKLKKNILHRINVYLLYQVQLRDFHKLLLLSATFSRIKHKRYH